VADLTIGRVPRPPLIALTLSRPDSPAHQVVTTTTLGAGLVPTMSVGDFVEAFESNDGRWLVGVQWHPERTHEVSADATGIIKAFVEQAANR